MKVEVTELDETLTENFVRFCCDHMGIEPELITIEGWEEPFKDEALGLCYELDFKEDYLIMVQTKGRNTTEIYDTIAHELIHVKQFMIDNLSENLCKQHRPVYDKRWYEIEAKEKSFNLVQKYVDNLYNTV
jgi:hypothetical protein